MSDKPRSSFSLARSSISNSFLNAVRCFFLLYLLSEVFNG